MSLFKKPGSCGGNAQPNCCCKLSLDTITSVAVLGAGCPSCHRQYENVKAALLELGSQVSVEYVTDMAKVVEYGVMSLPAIVVNGKVISSGKVLSTTDFKKLLDKQL